MAWLYWKDYLGLDPAAAAATAGWAIKTLAGATRPPQRSTSPAAPAPVIHAPRADPPALTP